MTPLERSPRNNGRKGKASLDGCRCPFCNAGQLRVVVGPCEVIGRMVPEVVYNTCDHCGERLLTAAEFRRHAC